MNSMRRDPHDVALNPSQRSFREREQPLDGLPQSSQSDPDYARKEQLRTDDGQDRVPVFALHVRIFNIA